MFLGPAHTSLPLTYTIYTYALHHLHLLHYFTFTLLHLLHFIPPVHPCAVPVCSRVSCHSQPDFVPRLAFPVFHFTRGAPLRKPETPSSSFVQPQQIMSKKHEKQIERQLIDIVNSRANDNKCGECSTPYPTWASWNLGILLCGRCASIHKRILGGDKKISKVKSLTLDHWSDEQVENLRRIGNKRAKKKWNPKRQPFPYDDDDEYAIEEYFRDKYVLMKFRDDRDDHDDRFSRYSDDSSTPTGSRLRLSSVLQPLGPRRLRNSSRAVPRLSHRKFTPQELGQYTYQVGKIMGLGFTNRDSVLESLILSSGNIEFALDILDQDEKLNPNKTELPPQMPKRPAPAASQSTASVVTAATGATTGPGGADWWTNSSALSTAINAPAAAAPAATGQPQIYQYTDPVTGAISYVDSNGQQYLDPNNPQHQQAIQQQTNPQLVAQQTNKQNILSLYNKPDQFVTNVAAKVDPNQPQSQPAQQQPQFTGFQPQTAQFQQPTGFQQPQATGFVSPFGQPAAYGQTQGFAQPQYQFQQQPQQQQQQQQFGQYGQYPQQQQYWG